MAQSLDSKKLTIIRDILENAADRLEDALVYVQLANYNAASKTLARTAMALDFVEGELEALQLTTAQRLRSLLRSRRERIDALRAAIPHSRNMSHRHLGLLRRHCAQLSRS